jgi:hypothetical protein
MAEACRTRSQLSRKSPLPCGNGGCNNLPGMSHHHNRAADKPGKRWRLGDIIGGVAVAGFIAFLFSLVIADLVQSWKMRAWPYTEATLVDRRLMGMSASESSRNPGINYHVDYVFRYEWQGQTYYIHEQDFVKMSGSDRKFWEFRSPADVTRTARLNPRNPADATLKWGIAWGFDIAVGSFAIGCLLAGFLWLYRPAGPTKHPLQPNRP